MYLIIGRRGRGLGVVREVVRTRQIGVIVETLGIAELYGGGYKVSVMEICAVINYIARKRPCLLVDDRVSVASQRYDIVAGL